MRAEHENLWKRISDFSFDEGDESLTFSHRLSKENGWSETYASRVIAEYRRFMFLATVAGHPVTPSDQVDQVWHLHLVYTRSYWDRWCQEILGIPMHHGPTKGGHAENDKFVSWYEQTKQSYEAFFNERPPDDIWPPSAIRFGQDVNFRRVNTERNWVIPKSFASTYGLAAIPGLAVCTTPFFATSLRDKFGPFLGLGMIVLIFWLVFRAGRGGRGGGGSGGDVGPWWFFDGGGCSSGGDSGGDSGCGGGGCGGGGCGGG